MNPSEKMNPVLNQLRSRSFRPVERSRERTKRYSKLPEWIVSVVTWGRAGDYKGDEPMYEGSYQKEAAEVFAALVADNMNSGISRKVVVRHRENMVLVWDNT